MAPAAWIEAGVAGRAPETSVHIFGNAELATACSAEDCVSVPQGNGPHRRRVVCAFGMALVTRIPPFTTVESDCDNVVFVMPVSTTRKAIYLDAVNQLVVDGVE